MNKSLVLIIVIVISLTISGVVLAQSKFINEWQKVVEENTDLIKDKADIELEYKLAVAYANLGKIEESTEVFKRIDSAETEEKLEEIITKFENKLKTNLADIKVNNYLAFAYYIDKQYNKAEEIFKDIIKMDSENIWSYNYLAVVQHKLEEYEQAQKSLEASLKLEKNQYTHFLLGVNYYKKGNIFKALYYVGKGRKAVGLFLDD